MSNEDELSEWKERALRAEEAIKLVLTKGKEEISNESLVSVISTLTGAVGIYVALVEDGKVTTCAAYPEEDDNDTKELVMMIQDAVSEKLDSMLEKTGTSITKPDGETIYKSAVDPEDLS